MHASLTKPADFRYPRIAFKLCYLVPLEETSLSLFYSIFISNDADIGHAWHYHASLDLTVILFIN